MGPSMKARLVVGAMLAISSCNGSSGTKASSDSGDEVSPPVDAGPFVDVGPPTGAVPGPASVLQPHLHPSRDGFYTDPKMTREQVGEMHIDPSFDAVFDGITFGEMLYVDGFRPAVDALFIATSTNHVTAFYTTTGQQIWDKVLGPTVDASSIACPQPSVPTYGIQATPIIDPTTRTIYVASFQPTGTTPAQTTLVYAMSIDDGTIRPGWPVDVGKSVKGFDPTAHHVRAGLALLDGTVYVAFSSLYDACPDYHGWVVGISTTDSTKITAWSTSANRGGIWGCIASDGTSLYTSTGNTAVGTTQWGGGEAVIRLPPSLAFSGKAADYFAPSNWQALDSGDLDMGSGCPMVFDLPGATPSTLVAAIGKEGTLFLLDRQSLGGIGVSHGAVGEGLFSQKIAQSGVHGLGATYETAKGRYVVVRTYGSGIGCPNGTSGDLVAVRVSAASPPKFSIAWCATSHGYGSPVVSTTDGHSDPVVWVPAPGGANRLYGFDGDTGAEVYAGGGPNDVMSPIWRWASPVIAKGRLYVAGQGKVYAFAPD
jgi:hypothetical protein